MSIAQIPHMTTIAIIITDIAFSIWVTSSRLSWKPADQYERCLSENRVFVYFQYDYIR